MLLFVFASDADDLFVTLPAGVFVRVLFSKPPSGVFVTMACARLDVLSCSLCCNVFINLHIVHLRICAFCQFAFYAFWASV